MKEQQLEFNEFETPELRYRALLDLLKTAEALWQGSKVFFAKWEISPSQFNVLNLLRASSQGMTQTALSKELLMHRSNMTGIIDSLERRKLVVRNEIPGDRRVYLVKLTDKGAKLVQEILPYFYQLSEEVMKCLERDQVKAFIKELQSIYISAERLIQVIKNKNLPSKL
jgi:DNA-binding MarR family transcriptional regulator